MKSILPLFVCCLLAACSFGQKLASGYAFPHGSGTLTLAGQNPIEAQLFKPEVVMQNQRALDLTKDQKDAILDDYQQAQSDFTRWQWELQAATEELIELVSEDQINEQASLAKLEEMLNLERNIKSSKLGLMIKIKNQLTPEQQEKLRALRFPGYNGSQYFDALKYLNQARGFSKWRKED